MKIATFIVLSVIALAASHGTGGDLDSEHDKVNRFRAHASRDHILEDLQHQINTKKREEMTDQELQFHYFKLHDFDNNNLLDGLEIIKALTHAHDEAAQHAQEGGSTHAPPPKQTEEELVTIIDDVLRDDDLDGDGYVSFYEFMADRGVNASPPAEGTNDPAAPPAEGTGTAAAPPAEAAANPAT